MALVLGVSGCIFLPFFRYWFKKKLIVNIDGLEHRREKWGKFAKWFLRKSEAMAVKYADIIVADNKGIQNYVMKTYHKESAHSPTYQCCVQSLQHRESGCSSRKLQFFEVKITVGNHFYGENSKKD